MKNSIDIYTDSPEDIRGHQIKTRWYYWFWGAATLTVLVGQIYVGTGYRQMSNSLDNLTRIFYKNIDSIK